MFAVFTLLHVPFRSILKRKAVLLRNGQLPPARKPRRLNRSGPCGKPASRPIARFHAAIEPVRFTHDPNMFEARRSALNQVLAFSGYSLGKDPSTNKGANYGRRGARLARREERGRVGRWRGRTSNDAEVSIVPPKIPYGGFSPGRLQGWPVRRCLPPRYAGLSLLRW